MSDLLELKQKMATIGQIKKLTQTLRLVAISHHGNLSERLKNAKLVIGKIKQTLTTTLNEQAESENVGHRYLLDPDQAPGRLIIIVSASKGLCGSYNSHLRRTCLEFLNQFNQLPTKIIVVGNHAEKTLGLTDLSPNINIIEDLGTISNVDHIHAICSQITQLLLQQGPGFSNVWSITNSFVNLFIQKPIIQQLAPWFTAPQNAPYTNKETSSKKRTILEQDSTIITKTLTEQWIFHSLYGILLDAFLAENAARFIAMDGASRNAQKHVEALNLQLHKHRQNMITKELSELCSIL